MALGPQTTTLDATYADTGDSGTLSPSRPQYPALHKKSPSQNFDHRKLLSHTTRARFFRRKVGPNHVLVSGLDRDVVLDRWNWTEPEPIHEFINRIDVADNIPLAALNEYVPCSLHTRICTYTHIHVHYVTIYIYTCSVIYMKLYVSVHAHTCIHVQQGARLAASVRFLQSDPSSDQGHP